MMLNGIKSIFNNIEREVEMIIPKMLVRQATIAGIVAGAIAAMAVAAQAADTLAKIKDTHAIVMGFYNEPPHN